VGNLPRMQRCCDAVGLCEGLMNLAIDKLVRSRVASGEQFVASASSCILCFVAAAHAWAVNAVV
jgi:hypothetical protein